MTNIKLKRDAAAYHLALPSRIRAHLKARGISDEIIDKYKVGFDGIWITIPITNQDGDLAYIKRARDPDDNRDQPKYLLPPGAKAELFGWDSLKRKPRQVIVCEGEFDRLTLESQGFAAVTSTTGAASFKLAWVHALSNVPNVLTSFDRDHAGTVGAERVARLLGHARIVTLPEEVGEGGDIGDFFGRLGRTAANFQALCDAASRPKHLDDPKIPPRMERHQSAPVSPEAQEIKARIPVEDLVACYVELKRSGSTLKGTCPFHEDKRPSFVVFPATRQWHCFGCNKHGDAISFLMRIESLTFLEALHLLQHIES